MSRLASEHLWADVARLRLELTKQDCARLGISGYFFGSGRLIGRNLVLTAKHVLESSTGISLPDEGWEVRLLSDQVNGCWSGDPIPSTVVWRGQGELDLALLWLKGAEERQPHKRIQLRFGKYRSTSDLNDVWFAGFPWVAREQKNVAREYSSPGRLRDAGHGRLYRLTVAAANAPKKDEGWRGISGGNVLLRRRSVVWLLGVVQQAQEPFGSGALDVAPLEKAFADGEFMSIVKDCCSNNVIEALDDLPGRYEIIGAQAFAASSATFDANADKPFYGRVADITAIDSTLEGCDRPVILLRGEAGMGKSSLAARWADHRARDIDTTVLRHAFSVRERRASTQADMVESLVRQAAFALGPKELGEEDEEPGDARRLEDRLVSLLRRDQPDGARLIVVIDALDEAAEPIEPWCTTFGRGVHLLTTCRAEEGETPAALRTWRERYVKLAREYVLQPLDDSAIAAWLTAVQDRKYKPTDPIVVRALKASEGVPLFATFLIPHAIEQLRSGVVDPLPANFRAYAHQQLDELRTRIATISGRWSWGNVRNLFALLAVAKAPLPPVFIERFLEISNGATLDELDQRAERWLWRRMEMVSFAHPRGIVINAVVVPGKTAVFRPFATQTPITSNTHRFAETRRTSTTVSRARWRRGWPSNSCRLPRPLDSQIASTLRWVVVRRLHP
jgi:hypothetical protein